jgi:hypothetical protein
MSAYIVDNKTIHAIVKGFRVYGAAFDAEDYNNTVSVIISVKEMSNAIGQSLLNQNYKSVNCRYRENTETPKYNYEDVKINEGILIGCIDCYEYQACETDDYFNSDIHFSLLRLKNKIIERMIKEKGQEIPWGYED